MTRDEFLRLLADQPLVVSVQATEGSPADETDVLLALARASVAEGVRVLRLEGVDRISRIRGATRSPAIGLIKRRFRDSGVYITPTISEVDELLATGCEVIALDGTARYRSGGVDLRSLIGRIHRGGALAMADCDSLAAALTAIEAGADVVGTTLAGYTEDRPLTDGPDLGLVREIVRKTRVPVVAEGRYGQRWQVDAALRIGAAGVVVGGAINDPIKTTRAMIPSPRSQGIVAAVDIGGTWLRFAVFSPAWDLLEVQRTPLPPTKAEREGWIKGQLRDAGACAMGVSTGGVVDPRTGEVWTAKEYLLPDHIGSRFDQNTYGIPVRALDDGLATAWGHACLPDFAGSRVATLALGTGVGCGFVCEGRIWMGKRGEYSHLNDMPLMNGRTCEETLAGRVLGPSASEESKDSARQALRVTVQTVRTMWFPDEIVVCGAVGLSAWMQPTLADLGVRVSPFGSDAGLFGAAALVLYPPD